MSLYAEWQGQLEGQTKETFDDFWTNYSETETKIYSDILDNPTAEFSGKVSDLVEKYQADPVLFMGFLDGIQSSLKTSFPLENIDLESEIKLDIDLEALYFNMLKADASYLYELPQWDNIFSQEKLIEIEKAFKKSKTIVKDKKIGRNSPCPCGSNKKYKHCCGKDQ